MLILELFSGTRSIGKAFEKNGHEVISVDYDIHLPNIDHYCDIGSLTSEEVKKWTGGRHIDVIWASPDCTSYSIAGIHHHRVKDYDTGNLIPLSDYAKFCDNVNQNVLKLIKELKPTLWFIENPIGGLRKMFFMQGLPRFSLTYCKYETDIPVNERRMKPTDIWTNHPNPNFLPMSKNGDKDHEPSPRGSACGTQRLKNARERGVIPHLLCEYIVLISEEYIYGK